MKSKRIILCGLFCAIGVLLPQVFHIFGESAGAIFLPMHLPVMLAGLLLGSIPGAVVGVVSPILSTLLCGMPGPVTLPFMLVELTVYGIVTGCMMRGSKSLFRAYIALLGAQALGRLAKAFCLLMAAYLFQMDKLSALAVWAATVFGLPGILIQLVFIPPVYAAVQKGIYKNIAQ